MATCADVRRIALSLPETREDDDRFAFSVRHGSKDKGFVWVWRERVDPKRGRVPNMKVIAIRVAGETVKDALLASNRNKFFTEPHYDGYPAVLVRLAKVGKSELEALLREAWRCQAPQKLVNRLG